MHTILLVLALLGCRDNDVEGTDTATITPDRGDNDTGDTSDTDTSDTDTDTSDTDTSDTDTSDTDTDPPPDTDADGDGVTLADGDCDDTDASAYPDAPELCDGIDNDCDTVVDNDVTSQVWYEDADGDGHGSATATTEACSQPLGYVASGEDCDDDASSVYPDADELCDDIDNDCDGVVDNGVTPTTWYEDADGDGFGIAESTTDACSQPLGYTDSAGDCDDAASDVNPGADELCNGIDDNCSGVVDDPGSAGETFYADSDRDGQGDANSPTQACSRPAGHVSDSSDCDDTDANRFVGATEICDGLDTNCNGLIDDGAEPVNWYPDIDADGYGADATPTLSCEPIPGRARNGDDCDDEAETVNPAATELCDGVDQNCDGKFDTDLGDTCTCDLRSELTCESDALCVDIGGWEREAQPATCMRTDRGVNDEKNDGNLNDGWQTDMQDRALFWDVNGDALDSLVQSPGTWTMSLTFDAWMNSANDRFRLEYETVGGDRGGDCRGWTEPFEVEVTGEYTVTSEVTGLAVVWNSIDWTHTLPTPAVTFNSPDCTAAGVDGDLSFAGTDLNSVVFDNRWEDRMDGLTDDLANRYADALIAAWQPDQYLGCAPAAECDYELSFTTDPADATGQVYGKALSCDPLGWTPAEGSAIDGIEGCQ